ncbi:unnamed protein product, partial [Brenthis ino]
MSSRSKKIMELINFTTEPAHDTKAQIQDPILNPDPSQSPIDEDSSVQNDVVDVAMLRDITNKLENQRYYNATDFFVNYNVSPVHSGEISADISDNDDPTYDSQIKKKKIEPVHPSSRRSTSSSSRSSSSSLSSSGSSSSSSSSSSDDDTVVQPSTFDHVDDNTINNTDTTANGQSTNGQETSKIENSEMNELNIEEEIEIIKKKGRKRTSNPQKWKQNLNKILRNSGRSYETTKKKTVAAREVKPPCTDKCRLKCYEKFTSLQRQAIFDTYWNIGELNLQRSFIQSCMSDVTPRYKYTNAMRPREANKAFHFIVNGRPIRVCKPFFVGTLNISDRVIRTVIQKCQNHGVLQNDRRGKHDNHTTTDETLISDIKTFIDSIPRVPSHYTRQTSTREYIDGGKTITDLFNDFKVAQEKNSKPYEVSRCKSSDNVGTKTAPATPPPSRSSDNVNTMGNGCARAGGKARPWSVAGGNADSAALCTTEGVEACVGGSIVGITPGAALTSSMMRDHPLTPEDTEA